MNDDTSSKVVGAAATDDDDDEKLDAPATCAFLGGSKPIHISTLYRGVRAGIYAQPIKITPCSNRWLKRELKANLAVLMARRGSKSA